MSNERIDHAKEARRITADIESAIYELRGRNDLPLDLLNALNANAVRDLTTAQVHATLALVEQQRINNVIRLESMTFDEYARLTTNVNTTKLREGLGL